MVWKFSAACNGRQSAVYIYYGCVFAKQQAQSYGKNYMADRYYAFAGIAVNNGNRLFDTGGESFLVQIGGFMERERK